MRVYGPNGTGLATAPSPVRRTTSGTFTLSEAGAPQAQSATVALRMVGGIDALLALQGVEDPAERRRRAVKQGRRALDALDELKLGLLAGTLDRSTMLRLKSMTGDLKDSSGDDKLDRILAEIDLRVEVELAKAGIS
jgi:Class II flagellar assembly regulator